MERPDRVPGDLHAPPADLPLRRLPLVISLRPWLRLFRPEFDPIHFGRTRRYRFNAPSEEFGVLYAATDAHGAFVETLTLSLPAPWVDVQLVASRHLARIIPARPLRLVDLTGSGLARIGADARLTTGEYVVSQIWALALWSHPEQPDGILYPARHDTSRHSVAIFDRAADAMSADVLGDLVHPPFDAVLADIVQTYDFILAGELPFDVDPS